MLSRNSKEAHIGGSSSLIYRVKWSHLMAPWGNNENDTACCCGRRGTLPVGYDAFHPIGCLCSGCALSASITGGVHISLLTLPGHEHGDYVL